MKLQILVIVSIFVRLNNVLTQDCSSSPDNIDYMGSMSVTESSKPCQVWPAEYSRYLIDDLKDANNFCRNPQGLNQKERAWCFTDLASASWEYCNITKCIGCSKVHGIAHGTIKFAQENYNEDESFQPGTVINFNCNVRSIYDPNSGPLQWICNSNSQWSESKLPRCLWRGYLSATIPLADCWSYSSSDFYSTGQPRRLYYGTTSDPSCTNWESSNQYTDLDFPEEGKLNAVNFCRSPNDYVPSCLDSSQSLKTCNVPKCNGCASIPYIRYSRFNLNYNLNRDENTAAENSILTFSCNYGTLSGDGRLVCRNGKWISTSIPSCQLSYCSEDPQQPSFTFISYRKNFYASIEDYGKQYFRYDKSVLVYLCTSEFKFDDDSVNQLVYECNSGQWILKGKFSNCVQAGPAPVQPTGQYCTAPSDVENSYKIRNSIRKVGVNQYVGEFELACYSGFKLVGNSVVKCLDGNWTPYPKCSQGASCPLNILSEPAVNVNIISSNLIYDSDNTGLIPGSSVLYECLPGTVPEISQDDLKVTCLDSGRWSSKIPVKCV